jgi:hypothetical protein
MKKFFFIAILLLATVGRSQSLRIDSMFVDEMKGQLQVYGEFGSSQGKVTVDSVDMQIKTWTDSLITTTIPDSGKGSAGPVQVSVNNLISKKTMITTWSGRWSYIHNWEASLSEDYGYTFIFSFRADIHSFLRLNNFSKRNFIPGKASIVRGYDFEGTHNQCGIGYMSTNSGVYIQDTGSPYAHGFHCEGQFGMTARTILFRVTNVKGIIGQKDTCIFQYGPEAVPYEYHVNDFYCSISFDSAFQIIPQNDTTSYSDPRHDDEFHLTADSPSFLPPSEAFGLEFKPRLISPHSGTIFSYRNQATLVWDTIALMSAYHLQIATDSTFTAKSFDTILSSTEHPPFPLAGLKKYYWRVAGVNSEGESRWSDTWHFWTGATDGIMVEEKNIPQASFSCYPNPSQSYFNINFLPSPNTNARFILYDLTGRIIGERNMEPNFGECRWDVSEMPSGNYILGLEINKDIRTKTISILH